MDAPVITPSEAAAALSAAREDFVLLDVREAPELQIVAVNGAQWVPMGELQARVGELDKHHEIAVLCHSGRRSHMVTEWLRSQGYARARNVVGGIDRWSCDVDPSLPRY